MLVESEPIYPWTDGLFKLLETKDVVKKDVLSESLETEARLSYDDRNVVSIVDKSTNNFC